MASRRRAVASTLIGLSTGVREPIAGHVTAFWFVLSGLVRCMQIPPFKTLYFEDLAVGMRATIRKTVENEDVIGFAELSGDHNPIHLSSISPERPALAAASFTGSIPRA